MLDSMKSQIPDFNVTSLSVFGGSLAGNRVLPSLSVGEMTLRLYGALNYNQNSAHDFRCALNGA